MKIILLSIGTRGDMEPFLAIGEILRDKGHQVICAFPEQFRGLAEESNLEFTSLGWEYIQTLESELGKKAMGGHGSGVNKFIANLKLASTQTEINEAMVFRQHEIIQSENPDRVLYNGKATYPVIWELDHPGKTILICPLPYIHEVSDHSHVAFNRNLGPFLNRLTYSLAEFGQAITVNISARWLKLPEKITRKQIKKVLSSTKAIYTISPSLFPRPETWPENLKVLGFHQRTVTTNWRPDKALSDFLARQNRILFITFGSMTNPEPGEKTKIFTDILERNKIPAIINIASGGLVKPDYYDPELVHFVPRIPYDWILPKMYAVIHHGGSGTTHLALKYGCAAMVIPHIIDQFVWAKIGHDLGVGPEGIKIDKMSVKNLEPQILALMNNRFYKTKAEQVASQMRAEDFSAEMYKSILEV